MAIDRRLGRGQGVPETVFLDANVLYSACCRDLLIEANLAGLCACRWSDGVLAEVRQALRRARPDLPESALQRTFNLLSVACPDALSVSRSGRPPLSRARHLAAMRASGLPHLAAHLDS